MTAGLDGIREQVPNIPTRSERVTIGGVSCSWVERCNISSKDLFQQLGRLL
jgi:hypothetical protein